MSENEIKQIMINDRLIGITGLDDSIKKIAAGHKDKNDEEIKKSLLRKITNKNYVSPAALVEYGQALLREFKIAQGLPVTKQPAHGLNIAVLGMGCARCSQLEDDVRNENCR